MKINKRKLQRELIRPKNQLQSLLMSPFEKIKKRIHDKNLHANITTTDGLVPVGKKVAIYLIYQPKKLAESTLLTCAELVRNGYALMIISNTPLPDETKQKLIPLCWQIVERPNFGYDFGGYRDGIRLLRESGHQIDCLIVMNDSVWWPVFDNDTTVQRAETCEHDFSGMILRPKGKKRAKWRGPDLRAPHIQSYFYWFGSKVLNSDTFHKFWQNYPVSSFKYNAIQRGELQLTKHLLNAGMSVDPVFSYAALRSELAQRPDEYLRKVMTYCFYKDDDLTATSKRLLAAEQTDSHWREEVFALFDSIARQSEFHMSIQFACVDLIGLNFVKRSAAEPGHSPHHVVRRNFLKAVEVGDLPQPIPAVLTEIKARHKDGAKAVGR